MLTLKKDLENHKFYNVYLLYGEEVYIRNQYRDNLAKALGDPEDSMNFFKAAGNDVTVEQIIDLAETMPFLAEKRVILLEDTGWFSSSNEKIAMYIAQIPETTVVIFNEQSVEKNNQVYKAVKKNGCVAVFERQTHDTLAAWLAGRIRAEHKRIDGRTLELFLQYTGDDMMQISNELEKLVCYTMDHDVITAEDIEAICPMRFEDHIFDMLDAIMAGNTKKAITLYGDLLNLREAPLRIMASITRQIRLVLHVKGLLNDRRDLKTEIPGIVGAHPFAVKKAGDQARRKSTRWLQEALSKCADTDEAFKSGKISDQIGLETLIVELSMSAATAN